MKIRQVLLFILVVSILLSASPYALASGLVGDTVSSVGDFWTAMGNSICGSSLNKWTFTGLNDNVCTSSDDSRHHGSVVSVDMGPAQGDSTGPYYVTCHCNDCGKEFQTQTYRNILNDAYKESVEKLPANTIDSENGLIWKPTVFDMRVRLTYDSDSKYKDPSTLLGMTALNHLIRIGDSPDYAIPSIGDGSRIFGIACGGSGSGGGSGGSGGLFSGLFSIIWDFFSFFWSFFNDFVVGGIKSFLSGLLSTAGSFLSFLNPFNWFA